MSLLTLDKKGVITALILGLLIYYVGGIIPILFMLFLLILSAHVTYLGYYEKKTMHVYEYERSWKNVISNGLIPLIALLLPTYRVIGFLSALSAVLADKFSSEIGVFGGKPIELFSFKSVKPGKSGAVTSLGFFAAFVGAIIISLLGIFFYKINVIDSFIIIIAGFLGSLFDSIAGYFEERGIGNKSTSNLFGSLVGMLVAILLKVFL